MAWYRCMGGSGLPAGLQTDMDAVLNKKFSTSTTYPPADWPDTVNLMGPLTERTASGSIAHIEDGASEVPLKNWLVTLPASLSGYSAIVGTQINSDNLMGFPSVDFTYKNVRYYTVDGVLYLDGTSTGETSPVIDEFKVLSFTLKAGTYYFNRGALALPSGIYKKSDGTQLRVNNGSFTLAEDTECNLGFYVYNKSFSNQKADVCLNTGSTAITYTDTTAPTQYTASLGRTIYGGTADIVTGEGVETHKGYTLDNLTWSGGIIGGNWVWYTDLSADGLKLPANSEIFSGICDNYTPIRYNGVSSNTNTIALRSNGYLYINNGSSETEPTGKVTIELDTPTDFTFTPITPTPETALGTNNFWADEGDSSVTYRSTDTVQPAPTPTLITKNITVNGTYTASSDSADGYSEVTVSVQASAFLVNDTNWSTSGLTYSKSVTITTAGNYAIRWSSYSERPTIKVNNTTLSFTYSNASRYVWYLNETVALGVGDTISFELSASGNNAYIAQVEEVE